MADVNARAGGTLNQDPFSVNMSDGVGQGQEPEISPTAPDDDLNKNADELEYLNDTDHSTMLNETNLIQSMQETLAANDSGDHEFRGDYNSDPQEIQRTLESIDIETTYLTGMMRKINAIGISQSDVFSLELRHPGILVKIGNGFSLESNAANKTFALEAIKDKYVELKTKASELFAKLIEWISNQLRQLGERLRNGRFSAVVKRFNTLKANKISLLEPSEIRRILGDEAYQTKIIATLNLDSVNAQLKSKITADDLGALRTGSTVTDILRLLSTQSAIVPKNFGHFKHVCNLTAEVANDLSRANSTLFVADAMFEPTRADETNNLSKSIINDGQTVEKHGNENTLTSIIGITEISESDLRDLFKFYSDAERGIADAQKKLKAFMDRIKTESPDQIAAYKDQREQVYDFLRGIQETVNHINRCVFLEAVVLNLVNGILVSHSKANVYKLKTA